MTVRTIGIVTVGRSDYQIYGPIITELERRDDIDIGLFVSGEHLVTNLNEAAIRAEHKVFDRVEMLLASDGPSATALSMGVGMSGFARSFGRYQPDMVILLGDRFEMFVAASAAVPFNIPLLHLHGGEITEGAMDDRFRHAITKLSHLHCVSTELSGRRICQMGEEPWRVQVTGAPGLDVALAKPTVSRATFFAKLQLDDPGPFILATYHPVTNEPDPSGRQISALLAAIERSALPVLFTTANADPGGKAINARLHDESARAPNRFMVVREMGDLYSSAMAHASVMLGNSSSGIIEACSYGLPVVNVGSRQAGRERSDNVIDCNCKVDEVLAALARAVTPENKRKVAEASNVYGAGVAASKIAKMAATTPIDTRLLIKRFVFMGNIP